MRLAPLSAKQLESVLGATARINIWHGSVRSGKTIASLVWWADAVDRATGLGDLVMVGKTERTLERNALMPLQSMLGTDAVDIRRGSGEAWILGKRVYTVGANDERAEQKIRGGTFEKVYGDELTLWPESFLRMTLSRLSVEGAQLGATTNPDSPAHYVKRDFIDRAGELNLRAFHFTLRDNETLAKEFLAALELEYTGLWKKRFIDGLWVMAEGAIWDAWDEDVHVVEAIPDDVRIVRWIVGLDYGTSNPFVALLIGVDQAGGYWVADELRWDSRKKGRQKSDAQYREDLAAWLQGHGHAVERIYVDPSAASFIVECRRHGLDVVGPARNAVDDGLRHVATLIGQRRLHVVSTSSTREGLLAEIPSYSWDPKAQAKGVDEPLKVNDHGPDGLRYGTYSDSYGRISGVAA